MRNFLPQFELKIEGVKMSCELSFCCRGNNGKIKLEILCKIVASVQIVLGLLDFGLYWADFDFEVEKPILGLMEVVCGVILLIAAKNKSNFPF